MIFNRDTKPIQWKKDHLFRKDGETTGAPYANKQTKMKQQQNFDPYPALYIKINLKETIDIKVKPKTIIYLGKKIGENPCYLG